MARGRRSYNLDFCISTKYNPYDGFNHLILMFTGIKENYSLGEFTQETIKCIERNWEGINKFQKSGKLSFKKNNLEAQRKRKESKKIKWKIFKRDGFKCQECKSQESLEVDHIIPISKGGEDTIENLQTLCKSCNIKKKDRVGK